MRDSQESIKKISLRDILGVVCSKLHVLLGIYAFIVITTVALGLIARTVPQMNVFIVGLPLKIGVGLLAIALSLPLFVYLFRGLFAQFQRDILTLIKLL